MNDYQLTLVLNSNLSDEKRAALLTQIASKLGEVKNQDIWGKKTLAYPINHLKDGYFVNIEFATSPRDAANIDKNLKSIDDIVRFLLVKKD